MQKILTSLFIILGLCTKLYGQVLDYRFNNSFNESCLQAPALIPVCSDYFYTDTLQDLNGLMRTVYHFDYNCGLEFDNTAAGGIFGETYSIEMYFKFDNSMGFVRILDYKYRTTDFGLYGADNVLQFYDVVATPTTAIASGQYVHLIITRDSASQLVQEFINGALLDQFTDSLQDAVLDSSNILSFFRDDLVLGGEASSGSIALLRLHGSALDSAAVATAFATLETTLQPNGYSINDASQCLDGNSFEFTNNSPDTVNGFFTWYFGDGDSASTVSSQHSYATDGIYEVLLVYTSPGICVDTARSTVEVFAQPQPDLGPDVPLCNFGGVVLDAGAYSSYLWNDSTLDQTINPDQPGTYWVMVTDVNGCTGIDSVDLFVSPVLNIGPDSSYCGSVNIVLDAGSDMANYFWSDGSTEQTLSVTDSGTYIIAISDSMGCVNTDTIIIGILEMPVVDLGNDTVFCEGGILTLDAGPFFTYLWQDSTVSQTLDVSQSGFYSVQVTDVSGCSNTDSIAVIVNLSPDVNLGSDTTFCGFASHLLDAGNGFVSYLWNDSSTSSTLILSDSGMYTVMVIDTNGCQGGDAIHVSISAIPVISLGNDTSICNGSQLVLDPGAGFTSYQWNNGTSLSTLTVTISNTYIVLVTDSNGCQSGDTIAVTVLASPVVSLGADTSACSGDSVLLDAGSGFVFYLWSNGATTQTTYAASAGAYAVVVANSSGCSATDSVDFSNYPSPPTPTISYTLGNPIISDAPSGNQWYDQNGPISGATDTAYTPLQSGPYYVIVTDSNGCQSLPSNIIVYGLGVTSHAGEQVRFYPNPVTDNLNIILGNFAANVILQVMDMNGRQVSNHELSTNSGEILISTSALPSGNYFCRIITGSTVYNLRFIKQ